MNSHQTAGLLITGALADVFSTIAGITVGLPEQNPAVAWLMAELNPTPAIVLIKLLAGVVLLLLWRTTSHRIEHPRAVFAVPGVAWALIGAANMVVIHRTPGTL
jgi:hypothetical protein